MKLFSILLSNPRLGWHPMASMLSRVRALLLVGAMPLFLACESDSLKPPVIPDDRELYWDLELNHHAVMLSTTAPYDTLQLKATPQNYLGESLTGLPAAQYQSNDLDRVVVTVDGMLIALAPTSQPIQVYATITTGNLKHVDTVFVKVVANAAPPVPSSLSIHPILPDSAKVAEGRQQTIVPRVLDNLGNIMPDVPVYFRSLDDAIASNGVSSVSGIIVGKQVGNVLIEATTTPFGVALVDTLPYRVGLRIYSSISILDPSKGLPWGTILSPEARVGTGAVVVWLYNSVFPTGQIVEEFNVTFDDVDVPNVVAPNTALLNLDEMLLCTVLYDCGVGNGSMGGGPSEFGLKIGIYRGFPVSGTYEYRNTAQGTRGRIVVVDES